MGKVSYKNHLYVTIWVGGLGWGSIGRLGSWLELDCAGQENTQIKLWLFFRTLVSNVVLGITYDAKLTLFQSKIKNITEFDAHHLSDVNKQ